MKTNVKTFITANIFPRKALAIPGDVSYQDIIQTVCSACDLTGNLEPPTAPQWQYQFLPDGRQLTLGDAASFLTLLKQKYLIQSYDMGSDILTFRLYQRDKSNFVDKRMDIFPQKELWADNQKRLLWRDENDQVHYYGPSEKPIHNLGFIPSSGDAPPVRENYRGYLYPMILVDLRLTNTDHILSTYFEPPETFIDYAKVIETFDPQKTPAWWMEVHNMQAFKSTEGGAMPSSIAATAPYTPLETSNFNKNLSVNDNNIQAAFNTLDDHDHSTQAPTATDDFLIGGYNLTTSKWTWFRRTLAETITRLRTGLDNVYESKNADLVAHLSAYAPHAGHLQEALINGKYYARRDGSWQEIIAAAVWGNITGTLSDQTDLQTALNARSLTSHTHTSYLTDAPSDGKHYGRKNTVWAEVATGGGTWGSITGNLSSQTDLQAQLNARLTDAPNNGLQYVRLNGNWSPFALPGHGHTGRQIIFMHGLQATIAGSTSMYLVPAINGLVTLNGINIPVAGTILNLFIRINNTVTGSGADRMQFFVQKNVVDTTLAISLAGGAGAGSYADTNPAHAVAWNAGDVFGLRIRNNHTSTSCAITGCAVEFQLPVS